MFRCFYQSGLTGEIIDFTKIPFRMLKPNDLFNYEWNYSTGKSNENIAKTYRKKISSKKIEIVISAVTNQECIDSLNYLLSVLETDVTSKISGKLYINGTYIRCYFMSCTKAVYHPKINFFVKEFEIILESAWIKETPYSFEAKALSLSNVKKYAYKYPYRYSISAGENFIENSHYADCNFKLRIYGPCVNPHIIIGTHRYQVWTILTAGEWLEIDSIHNKVYKVMVNGTKVSLFNERDKLSSVFEKIPPGRQRVSAPGTFNFDLILYEERSEPEWN